MKLYIVEKRNGNACGLVYDKRLYKTRKEAEADFRKSDTLLICKENDVCYGDNWQGWTCTTPIKVINK